MADVRAFVSIGALSNNTPGVIAQFGELSVFAQTYSRDKQHLVRPTAPDVQVVVFSARNDAGNPFNPNTATSTAITNLAQWVYSQYSTNSIPRNVNKAAFIAALQAQFPSYNSFVVGELLAGSTTTLNMPDYVRFTFTENGIVYNNTLWFSDARFRTQYDLYEINIVPPVSNVGLLNGTQASVSTAILSHGVLNTQNQVNAIVANHPPTAVQPFVLNWVSPTGNGATLETAWLIVAYGQGALDDSVIREAIRNYLQIQEPNISWTAIFPSLFTAAEYTVVPLWDSIHPLGTTVDNGVYSPLVIANGVRARIQSRLPGPYQNATNLVTHLNTHMQLMPLIWRGMVVATVGSPSNQSTFYKISGLVPDYLNVPSDSPDYARMSTDTQNFLSQLVEVLEAARTLGPTSLTPSGMIKVVSANRLFLAFNFGAFRILVLTRHSYTNLV